MMEVQGRHALLFDDDASCAFVNSREALVDWNSLLIDRYDVRHLLESIPLPNPNPKRRRQSPSSDEFQLDLIRYQDLPHQSQETVGVEATEGNPYGAVSFSYGNTDVSSETKNVGDSAFIPPFSVPQSLLQSLPPTEKLHQIMARTAIYVSEHGGQSEIVLRVKQGNNPTFGFLMPDHHLHEYFRFLVDHPDVLKSDNNDKAEVYTETEKKQKQTAVAGEALSLLGSVYGYEEDEDGADSRIPESDRAMDTGNASMGSCGHGLSGLSTRVDLAAAGNNSDPTDKEKLSKSKKLPTANAITGTSGLSKKKEGGSLHPLPDSLKLSRFLTQSSASKADPLIVEPPSEIKRTMEKIAEFILKNGKEFEAVLIDQDRANGRFPFLRPSNLYHSYYLKLIQESKQGGKQSSLLKDTETSWNLCSSHDLADNPDQKENFRMLITGPKKDAQEPTAAPAQSIEQQQYGMSVDTVAAILEAATGRGPRTKAPLAEQDIGSDDSSLGALSPSSIGLSDVSIAKRKGDLASEADSSEVGVTKEQKLKADRLKRAKMFAAIIKSGGAVAVPQKNDAETKDSVSLEATVREKENSFVPVGSPEKHRKMESGDNKERRSGKRHHYGSRARIEDDEEHSRRKKHRSHHVSSHRDENRRKRRDREYRRKYHDSSSSEDERRNHKSSRSSSIKPSRGENSSTTPAAQPPTGVTEVSDDLRAKVRAMLLATMWFCRHLRKLDDGLCESDYDSDVSDCSKECLSEIPFSIRLKKRWRYALHFAASLSEIGG